jgi:hypothetical protein
VETPNVPVASRFRAVVLFVVLFVVPNSIAQQPNCGAGRTANGLRRIPTVVLDDDRGRDLRRDKRSLF